MHFRLESAKLKLAIDLNLIPYYGEPSDSEKPYIYRSQAKQGTCSFYAYATLYSNSWSYEVQWKANRQIIELTRFL